MTPRSHEGVPDRKSQFVGEDHDFGCQRPMGGGCAAGREEREVLEAVSMDEVLKEGAHCHHPDSIRIPPQARMWPLAPHMGHPQQALLPIHSLGGQRAGSDPRAS